MQVSSAFSSVTQGQQKVYVSQNRSDPTDGVCYIDRIQGEIGLLQHVVTFLNNEDTRNFSLVAKAYVPLLQNNSAKIKDEMLNRLNEERGLVQRDIDILNALKQKEASLFAEKDPAMKSCLGVSIAALRREIEPEYPRTITLKQIDEMLRRLESRMWKIKDEMREIQIIHKNPRIYRLVGKFEHYFALPVLDLFAKMASVPEKRYPDFIKPKMMEAPVMRGIYKFSPEEDDGRVFLAVCARQRGRKEAFVQVLFMRYSNTSTTWSDSFHGGELVTFSGHLQSGSKVPLSATNLKAYQALQRLIQSPHRLVESNKKMWTLHTEPGAKDYVDPIPEADLVEE